MTTTATATTATATAIVAFKKAFNVDYNNEDVVISFDKMYSLAWYNGDSEMWVYKIGCFPFIYGYYTKIMEEYPPDYTFQAFFELDCHNHRNKMINQAIITKTMAKSISITDDRLYLTPPLDVYVDEAHRALEEFITFSTH